jgi:hypothetical protein
MFTLSRYRTSTYGITLRLSFLQRIEINNLMVNSFIKCSLQACLLTTKTSCTG